MLDASERTAGLTLEAGRENAGSRILALRGMVVDLDRENQLSGMVVRAQRVVENINGSD